MEVWSHIAKHVQEAGCCAMVTMTEVLGSAPREAGTRMVIRPDGGFHGTIGGGTLEWHIQAEAQKIMRSKNTLLKFSKHALGPELGQCCGGVVKLMIEVFTTAQIKEIQELARQEENGNFSTRGFITDTQIYREVVIEEHQGLSFDQNGDILENFGQRNRAIYLYGAGHIGKALMLNFAALPFEITFVDSRPEALPTAVPANFKKVFSPSPVETLKTAPDGAFILIMTHSHSLDLDLVNAALQADRFGYVGVIGSDTKKARFKNRLKSAGLDNQKIETMTCPIGINGIKSKHPASIAASVTAEMLIKDEELNNLQSIRDEGLATDTALKTQAVKFVQ